MPPLHVELFCMEKFDRIEAAVSQQSLHIQALADQVGRIATELENHKPAIEAFRKFTSTSSSAGALVRILLTLGSAALAVEAIRQGVTTLFFK